MACGWQRHADLTLTLTRRGCSHSQARDRGYASAAALQQLEAAALLRRVDALVGDAVAARAALAPRTFEATTDIFAALPRALALPIFRLLPADARAHAALVCRAWRDAVAEPSVWTYLDLTFSGGVRVSVTDAVLRGAAARARGQVQTLAVMHSAVSYDAVLQFVTANADSLHELYCMKPEDISWIQSWGAQLVERIARAASQLRILHVDVCVSGADAVRMVSKDEPFGALRLHSLGMFRVTVADLLALAAEMTRRQEPLQRLSLQSAPLQTSAALDALADAALACRLCTLTIDTCDLSMALVPALTRILYGNNLTSLIIYRSVVPLFDAAAVKQFADALASHRALFCLRLVTVELWQNPAASAAVLRAVTRHPTLQELYVSDTRIPDPAAAGAALGAVVAANAPALRSLWIAGTPLGDVGLRPLLDALATNTHLQMLDCRETGMSEDFARDVLLPAVLANTGLRSLKLRTDYYSGFLRADAAETQKSYVARAEALVAARGQR